MNKISLITSAAGIMLLLGSAAPALAEESESDSVSVNASTSVHVDEESGEHEGILGRIGGKLGLSASSSAKASSSDRIEKGQTKADSEIDKRIESLQNLEARLGKIKLLPSDVLASLTAALNTEIQTLTDLKAKIAADTSTTTLKADAQSITKAYRVYLLVEPKARIAAAASRIDAVVTQLTALAGKLQTRIAAAQGAGVDVSAAVSAMTDMNAKLADAKTQADAAVALTANLQADNGDKTVLAANLAKLKDARAKLAAAEQDLAAARHDAATIYGIVKGKGGVEGQGSLHATTTASSSSH